MLISNILISLLIGGIAGWLAGLIQRGHGFGLMTNIIIGIAGGFVGNLIFGLFGIQDTNFIGTIAVSTIGAIIVLSIASMFKKAS